MIRGCSVRSRFSLRRLQSLLAIFFVTILAAPASADLTTVTPAHQEILKLTVRGMAAAYDPVNNRFLVLAAQNHLVGTLVNAQGVPIQGQPQIVLVPKSAIGVPFASFPRAAYSPDVNNGQGGFLVIWAMEKATTTQIHMRLVSASGQILGTQDTVITDAKSWKDIAGPAIAYSHTSQRFLIAWKTPPPNSSLRLRVQLVSVTGALIGPSVAVSSGFGRDAGVTWNPNNDEFGVSYTGETTSGGVFCAFVRVPANNAAGFQRTTFNSLGGGLTTSTDISFNPETDRYVMSWFESNGGIKAKVAEINEAGTVLTMGPATFKIGSYDALGSDYNPVSKTILLSGIDVKTDDIAAAELNGRGFRITDEQKIIDTQPLFPGRYARVAAATSNGRWLTMTSRNFGAVWGIVTQSDITDGGGTQAHPAPGSGGGGGGGGGNPPPPPPPPGTCTTPKPVSTWVCVNTNWVPPNHPSAGGGNPTPTPTTTWVVVDTPTSNQTNVPTTFTVGGWAIDQAASNSVTGIDAIHVYAYAGGLGVGTAQLLGPAPYGSSRPDVAVLFGARFTTSGFGRVVTLAPGLYDLVVFARKTSDLTWISKLVRITVQ